MSFGHRFVLSICLLLASIPGAESQTRTRWLKIPGWFRFDIARIVDRLAAYVAASR